MTKDGADKKLAEFLKLNGLKQTFERKTVLKAVFAVGAPDCDRQRCEHCTGCRHGMIKHFSPDDISRTLQNDSHLISTATIYRVLQLLTEADIIVFAFKRNGRSFFEINRHDPHDHLICMKCGIITELDKGDIDLLHRDICDKYGFVELNHTHIIRGICSKCSSS